MTNDEDDNDEQRFTHRQLHRASHCLFGLESVRALFAHICLWHPRQQFGNLRHYQLAVSSQPDESSSTATAAAATEHARVSTTAQLEVVVGLQAIVEWHGQYDRQRGQYRQCLQSNKR